MKTTIIVFMLAVLTFGCSSDNLLVEQYEPEFTANPFLSDGYCNNLWGRMIDEQSAVIFTGRYGLYTEDDFKTLRYSTFGDGGNGIPCFGETMFFDGENVWTLYNNWRLVLSTTTESQAKAIEPYYLFERYEPLFYTNIQPPTAVLGLNTMLFTAYDSDRILKVCSLVDDKVNLLAEIETGLTPVKIFYSDDLFFLLTKREGSTLESHVFVSENAIDWNGPFLITSNGAISSIKESHGLSVSIDENSVYVSENNGGSWFKVNLPLQGEVQDVNVLNGSTIYAVIGLQKDDSFGWVSKLVMSIDKGRNWQLMDKEFYGESISFYNELHGIAMSKGVLQVTHDGGNSWKLILISNAVM